MKKFISILLTACMFAVMLTGCQGKVTAETLLTNADKKVTEAKSLDTTINLVMDIGMDYSGLSMNMGLSGDIDLQTHKESESAYMEAEMQIEVLGMEQEVEMESYLVKDGKDFISYSKSSENDGWTYEEIESPDMVENLNIFQYGKDNLEAFTLKEDTVEFENKECYLVEGILTGDAFMKFFELMNTEDMLNGADVDFKDMSLNVLCYFDKDSKEPVGVEMSLSEAFEIEAEDEAGSVAIDEFTVGIVYNSFDDVEEIEVPKKVKEEAVEAEDEDFSEIIDQPIVDIPTDEEKPSTEVSSETDEDNNYVEGEAIDYIAGMEKITLNNTTLTMPTTVKSLLDLGLVFEDDYEGYIVNKEQSEIVSMTDASGDLYLSVYLYNPTQEACDVSKCEVYGISVYADSLGELVMSSPLGFDFNSSYEQVVAVLGAPTSIYNGQYMKSCSWETEDYQYCVDVEFDVETGKVYNISIQNYYMY